MADIRPLRTGDVADLVALWHQGWHAAHAGLVPASVLAHRTPGHFRTWLASSSETIWVAEGGGLLGFVAVEEAELTKLYVAEAARGSGVAADLMAWAEAAIAERHPVATLFCIAGNARAERFYARQGWTLEATASEPLWVPPSAADRFEARTHRYRKRVRN